MANGLIDIESFCGFCNTRVGASLEDRRNHMFNCRKHPAFRLAQRHEEVVAVILAWRESRIDEVDALDKIEDILERQE